MRRRKGKPWLIGMVVAALAAPAAEAAKPGPIELEEVTREAGLWDPLLGMYGHGGGVADYDGDGWLDIFVGTFADRPLAEYTVRGSEAMAPDRLLRGGPDGFVADPTFPEMYGRTSGAAFADLDNDGDLDLALARNGRRTGGPAQRVPSAILRNDGGRFTLASELLQGTSMRQIGVLDYDGDGLLDLYFVEDHFVSSPRSVLLRNKGALEFEDVTVEAGLAADVTGLSVAVADFTGDGLTDLLVPGSQRTAPNRQRVRAPAARMFVNEGGSFRETDASAITMETYFRADEGGGVAVADLNRDGRQDLVIGQHILEDPEENPLLDEGQSLQIYLNRGLGPDGGPRFEDITARLGLTPFRTRVPHVEIADLDQDGWPDIMAGSSVLDGTKPAIFRHLGLGEDGLPRFASPFGLAPAERLPPPEEAGWERIGLDRYWSTGAVADFDRDGDVEPLLVEWFPDLPTRLFENVTENAGHWLTVDVEPARKSIGGTVEVYRPGQAGRPDALLASRPVVASVGYAGGVPATVHVGLGHWRVVDLVVRLPNGEGTITRRTVLADQALRVPTEG
jgi:hypothetical protein